MSTACHGVCSQTSDFTAEYTLTCVDLHQELSVRTRKDLNDIRILRVMSLQIWAIVMHLD